MKEKQDSPLLPAADPWGGHVTGAHATSKAVPTVAERQVVVDWLATWFLLTLVFTPLVLGALFLLAMYAVAATWSC